MTHLALRLLIPTGVRSKPIRFMREEQIEGDVWVIPANHMKGRKHATADFRVPIPAEVLRVINEARQHARDGYLFPSVRKGVISDATMSRRANAVDRSFSTRKTWQARLCRKMGIENFSTRPAAQIFVFKCLIAYLLEAS
ncbi:MAG: hypothetical protein AB3N24_03100 [Leisingera sp.]